MSEEKIEIVDGERGDASLFSAMMELSAPKLFSSVFGENFKRILESLFRERRNLFSFEHTFKVKIEGDVAGMLLGYDWKTKKGEEINTGKLLIKYMKFNFVKRLPFLVKLNSVIGYVNKGEFYISNIAIYPEYRGKGVGTLLLNFVEEVAKKDKIEKLSLDVETENSGAIKLYKRLGFKIVKEKSINLNGEIFKFYRMEKLLIL